MAGEFFLFLPVVWMATYSAAVFDMLRVNFQWTFMMIPQLVQGSLFTLSVKPAVLNKERPSSQSLARAYPRIPVRRTYPLEK